MNLEEAYYYIKDLVYDFVYIIFFKIFLWLGAKLFQYVDLYHPNDIVKGISFTNSKDYADAIEKIEVGD